MPSRMKGLPRDSVGRPVPFFVEWIDGKPDFRVMNPKNMIRAIQDELCWVCGTKLLRRHGSISPIGYFVAGPMCLVNRVSAEPPNHEDCAAWSARACPFLNNPDKLRRDGNFPSGKAEPPGVMITRNPGVTAIIESTVYTIFRPPIGGGVLWRMNRVTNVEWMAEGRAATGPEVLWSMETGMGALLEMADRDGSDALQELAVMTRDAMKWVDTTGGLSEYPTIQRALKALP
jgi:hypothetical protein